MSDYTTTNKLTVSTSTYSSPSDVTASAWWAVWNPDPLNQTITTSTKGDHLDNLGIVTSYGGPAPLCKNYEPPKESPEERKAREELERSIKKYTPKRIVYNNPATIVFWKDGTKTVVKCAETEIFSEYYGFLACLAKKIYGTNSGINRIIRKSADFPKKEEKSEPKKCPCMKNTPKNKKGTRKK